METWVERTCRTRCIGQAVLLGLVGLLFLVATAMQADRALDAFRGPYPVSADEIRKARSTGDFPRSFVEADCAGAADTGIVRSERSETSRYWAVPVGDVFFLVKADQQPSGRVAGSFRKLETDVSRLLDPADRAVTLPLFLNEGDPRIVAGFFLVFITAVTACVVAVFVRSLRRAIDPSRHPAVAAFASVGKLRQESARLESELSDPHALQFRGWVLTRSYLVDKRSAHFAIHRWRDLVWAHKLVTSHHMYLVIPTGKTFDPVFCFADCSRVQIQMELRWRFGRAAAETTVDAVLDFATGRAPWAVAGYSDEVEVAWKRDPAGFAAAVAKRRDAPDADPTAR